MVLSNILANAYHHAVCDVHETAYGTDDVVRIMVLKIFEMKKSRREETNLCNDGWNNTTREVYVTTPWRKNFVRYFGV